MESTQNHIVFIDESGDPGINDNSISKYFIISMVIFNNNEDVKNADNIINNLKIELKHKTEFKFSKSSNLVREKFFEKIQNINFIVKAIVVNKTIVVLPFFKSNSQNFYNFILKQLIVNSKTALKTPMIIIDGEKPKQYKEKFAVYLRQNLIIKDIKFVDSKKNNLVQMADMIASCIHYDYKNNNGNSLIKKYVKDKINIWDFK